MRRENIVKEILICFENQYPERYSSYKRFFERTLTTKHPTFLTNEILIYCNMVENLDILSSIIRECVKESTGVKE